MELIQNELTSKKTEVLQQIESIETHNQEKEEYLLQNIEYEKLLLKINELNDIIGTQKINENQIDKNKLLLIDNEKLLLHINTLSDSIEGMCMDVFLYGSMYTHICIYVYTHICI
jgi:hypothetical protein